LCGPGALRASAPRPAAYQKRADSKNQIDPILSTSLPKLSPSRAQPAQPASCHRPHPLPLARPGRLVAPPSHASSSLTLVTLAATPSSAHSPRPIAGPGGAQKVSRAAAGPTVSLYANSPSRICGAGGGGGRGNSLFKPYKINLQLSKTNLEHGAGNALRSLSATRSSPSRSSNPRATRLRTTVPTAAVHPHQCTQGVHGARSQHVDAHHHRTAFPSRSQPPAQPRNAHRTAPSHAPAPPPRDHGKLAAHRSATCIVKRCAHCNRPLTSHVPRAEARPSAPRELSRPAASTHPRRMSPSHSKIISNPPSLFLPARGRGETGGGGVRGERGGEERERRGLKFVNSAQPQRAVSRLRQ